MKRHRKQILFVVSRERVTEDGKREAVYFGDTGGWVTDVGMAWTTNSEGRAMSKAKIDAGFDDCIIMQVRPELNA